MFKTAVLAGLVLLDDIKPKPISRAVAHVTKPVPSLRISAAPIETIKKTAKKSVVRRQKHVCEYGRGDIWATFVFGLLLGGFLVYIF